MSRIPLDHWLLVLRTVLAAWLALFLSMRLNLSQPAWAVLAVMIVTLQPVMFTGGTPPIGIIIGRSIARLFGTLFGAIAGLVLIVLCAQQPMLYLLFGGAWLALCMYLVILEQDAYLSYVVMLSGYTATLVSLTAIGTGVEGVWTTALARFTETSLGIGCGLLMHILIAPRFGSHGLPGVLSRLIADAAGEALAVLDGTPQGTLDARFKALHGHYQRFESLRGLARLEARRWRHVVPALDRFASDALALLTGLRELEEACAYLRACPDGPRWLARLHDDARPLLRELQRHPGGDDAPAAALPELDWGDERVSPRTRVRATLVRQRLGEVLTLLRHGRHLHHALEDPQHPRVDALPRQPRARTTDNEHGVARYNALRVFVAFELLGQFWIHSGWHSGYLAQMLLGVFSMLFAKAPNPTAVVWQFLWGTISAVLLGGVLLFLVLPLINGFFLLALALAVPIAIGTLLTPYPRWAGMGLSGAVTMMTLLNLHTTYSYTPQTYINGGLAAVIGTLAAMLTYSLFRQPSPAERIDTLMAAFWRGLWRLTRNPVSALPERPWLESRLYDRLGRLVALGGSEERLREALDLHALAMCSWRLRRMRDDLAPFRAEIETWLEHIGRQAAARNRHDGAFWRRQAEQAEQWVARLYHQTRLPLAVIGEMGMLAHLMRSAPGARLETADAPAAADRAAPGDLPHAR